MDLFSVPWPCPLCHQSLVWVSLSSLSSPSVLRGLCALVFTLQARPLRHRACVHLSWLMGPTLCVEGFVCTCFNLPAHPVCHRACVSFFWLFRPTFSAARVMCTGEVCMPLHSQHPGPALCAVGLLWASLLSLSLPSGHDHSPWAVYGLGSAAFSVFCPLSPCFSRFS